MNKHNELALDQPGSADATTLRWNAALLAVMVALVVVAAIAGDRPLVASARFDGAYGALVFLLHALTTWVLFGHFRFRRLPSYLALGGAYLFGTLWGLLVLLSPAAMPDTPPNAVFSAPWRQELGHLGFAALMVVALVAQRRSDPVQPGERVPWLIAAAILLTVLLAAATAGVAYLTEPWRAARATQDSAFIMLVVAGGAAGVVNAVALGLAWSLARRRSILLRWLAVALTARQVEIAIGLGAYADYTVGWYAQRGAGLVAAAVLALVFLGELNQLHRRVAATLASLSDYRAHLEDMVAIRTAELAAAESKFRGLVEQSLAGIYIIQDGCVRYANPVFARMFGFDAADEVIDRGFTGELVAPEDREMVAENIRQRVEGDVAEMRYIFTAIRRDGSRRAIEVHGRRFDYEGRPAVIGIALDVTERKQAEDKLRQAATVFTSTREGVVITDLAGKVVAVNPAFTAITGYTEAEMIGRSMNTLRSGRHERDFYQNMWTALTTTGAWHGEMWNRRKSGDLYLQWLSISTVRDDDGRPLNYVAVATDITGMAHAENKFEYLAHHDALTGLPNRLLLSSRLEQAVERARRYGVPGAVLFIDLDRFKAVNDTLGHGAGDELLQLVARRLGDRLRETDTLARLGGDEFVVVLEEVANAQAAARVADELIAALHRPFVLTGHGEVSIGGSAGIALFPADGESVAVLIDRADKALYRAKGDGRGVHRFFRML